MYCGHTPASDRGRVSSGLEQISVRLLSCRNAADELATVFSCVNIERYGRCLLKLLKDGSALRSIQHRRTSEYVFNKGRWHTYALKSSGFHFDCIHHNQSA